MVTVVVNEQYFAGISLDLTKVLEASIDAFEFLERPNDCVIGDLQFVGNSNCGQCITHVVQTWQLQ